MIIDPHQQFIRRTGRFLLATGALGAALVAYLYVRQMHPKLFDLAMSIGLASSLSFLLLLSILRPQWFFGLLWTAFGLAMLAIAVPAWLYPIHSIQTGATLIDTLPPITSALMPVILTMIVFLRPKQVFVAATVAWIIVAGPILTYLFMNPDELRAARGMDMVVTLGPVMMLMLIYIPFHRGIERRVDSLQNESAKMQVLAERDGLTGLYNRRAGEQLLTTLVAAPDDNDALILFDLDHFKVINDTHGHPAGDEVLRQIARRCEALVRRDDVFARWGGEEFLLLVRGAQAEGVVKLAEVMRATIASVPIDPAGTVTASFGVALFRPHDTLDAWVQRADEALYAAKHAGRNCVVAR